jgi:hypothetical protein
MGQKAVNCKQQPFANDISKLSDENQKDMQSWLIGMVVQQATKKCAARGDVVRNWASAKSQ